MRETAGAGRGQLYCRVTLHRYVLPSVTVLFSEVHFCECLVLRIVIPICNYSHGYWRISVAQYTKQDTFNTRSDLWDPKTYQFLRCKNLIANLIESHNLNLYIYIFYVKHLDTIQEPIWVKRTRMEIMQKMVFFFFFLEFEYINLKTVQIKSRNMQCTILSIRVIMC